MTETFNELPYIDRDDVRLPRWLRRLAARDQTPRNQEPRWPSDFPTYCDDVSLQTGIDPSSDEVRDYLRQREVTLDEHPIEVPEGGFGSHMEAQRVYGADEERERARIVRHAIEGRRL